MLRVKQSVVNKLLKNLDEKYQTLFDTNLEPFFREEAEMVYKEILFRLMLINIPIERDKDGKHLVVQPYARRVIFLQVEEEMLEQINDLYSLVLGGKTELQSVLDEKVAKAKELGMEIKLAPGGYEFAHQYRSIFDIIPPYISKTRAQKSVRSQEKQG